MSVGKRNTGQSDTAASGGVVLSLVDLQRIPVAISYSHKAIRLLTLSSCLHCPVIYSSLNAITPLLMKARPWCSPDSSIHKSQQFLDAWDPQIYQRWTQHGSFSVKKTASLGAGVFYLVCCWCCYSVGRITLFLLQVWKEKNEWEILHQNDCVHSWSWEKVEGMCSYLKVSRELILRVCSQDCRWLTSPVLVCYSLTLRHHSWPFLNSFCPRWEDNLPVFHFTACSQVDCDS